MLPSSSLSAKMTAVWKRHFARIVTLGIVCASLAGCATTTGTAGTKSVCKAWLAISWSSHDTDETIVEVKANNARQKAWCG